MVKAITKVNNKRSKNHNKKTTNLLKSYIKYETFYEKI